MTTIYDVDAEEAITVECELCGNDFQTDQNWIDSLGDDLLICDNCEEN